MHTRQQKIKYTRYVGSTAGIAKRKVKKIFQGKRKERQEQVSSKQRKQLRDVDDDEPLVSEQAFCKELCNPRYVLQARVVIVVFAAPLGRSTFAV